MRLVGTRIALGVSGSIAAYKAVVLLRLLQREGAEVRVVMTPAAAEFVAPLTFRTLSRQSVMIDLWDEGTPDWTQHVHLGKWADLLLVAPATANTLAKFARGLCDDALSAVYLAADCPTLVCPAMDLDMYRHPAVADNLSVLRRHGTDILEAGSGYLASGLEGAGRLPEPEAILEAVVQRLGNRPLAGLRVLISAGPTREPIDPVRFLSNHSSGKMGVALAEAARAAGAEVTLVYGPAETPPPEGVGLVSVESAADMHHEMRRHQPGADIVLMAAAIADYRPAAPAGEKLKKTEPAMKLNLVRNPDILAELSQHKPPAQTLVGFALETTNALAYGQRKLEHKQLDMIVVNSLSDPGAGFGHSTNQVTILDKEGGSEALPLKYKTEVAVDILRRIQNFRAKQHEAGSIVEESS